VTEIVPPGARLRGTTALGTVLSSVGGLLAFLAGLFAIGLFLRPEILQKQPGAALSLFMTVLSRFAVLVTGVAVLRRNPRSVATAVAASAIIVLAAACDLALALFASEPSRFGRSVLIGSLSMSGALLVLLIVTILYLRRADARLEFGDASTISTAGA
jgi:fucose 4-O-acetylase-like acetyltransferase